MCDLTTDEKDSILEQLSALQDLVDQIKTSATSIEERNWIEHDEIDQLLVQLSDTAGRAKHWVDEKVHATHG